jgi:hypothetical protein
MSGTAGSQKFFNEAVGFNENVGISTHSKDATAGMAFSGVMPA